MKFKILSLCMAFAVAFGCVFGLASCKQEITVKSAELNADGELIITMTDGSKKSLGKINGTDGADGTGVKSAYIDEEGNLIIELTDGEKVNAGVVVTPDAGSELYYREVEGGYEVAGLANTAETDIKIPAVFNKKTVVSIAEKAFEFCGDIVRVTVPNSVKTIGKNAFADCGKLKNISFGSGVISVDSAAFARCEGLESVNVSDLGAWCNINFASPSSNPLYFASKLYVNNVLVTDLTIPEAVTSIGSYAFYECENIVSINTVNVKTIGESAFYKCPALESFTAGNSLEVIGEMAFSDCENLKTVNFGGGLKEIGSFAFQNCISITEISLPARVETLGESAFTNCTSLNKLSLNNGLKTIGDCAFGFCSSLELFIMPNSVTSLGFGILMNSEGGFEDNSGGATGVKEIILSDAITELPDFSFSKCSIKTITVTGNVEEINYSAFFGCGLLESVVIPKSLKHVTSYAFHNCTNLSTIFYAGNAAEWNSVRVGKNGNNHFLEAQVYYYSEERPTAGGTFWHYVNGVPAVWEI